MATKKYIKGSYEDDNLTISYQIYNANERNGIVRYPLSLSINGLAIKGGLACMY